MLKEALNRYLLIPSLILNHPFATLLTGFAFLLLGISANLWRFLYGDVINLVDWDDVCVYIGMILIAFSIASLF